MPDLPDPGPDLQILGNRRVAQPVSKPIGVTPQNLIIARLDQDRRENEKLGLARQGAAARLPEGPEVEIVRGLNAREAVASVLEKRVVSGLCRPGEVLVLGHRSSRANSSLRGVDLVGPWPLRDYDGSSEDGAGISYLRINKAKGLDALGVIVIDTPLQENAPERSDLHQLLFVGASRARQALAIVAPSI